MDEDGRRNPGIGCLLLRGFVVRTALGPVALVAVAFVLLLKLPPVTAQADSAVVWILVVKEHGVGSPTMVQPYLDRFVAIAAERNGWDDAKGQFFNNRSAAEAFIQMHHPHYGIFSLPAFLALQAKYELDVIGQVAVSLAGGRQYSLISKSAADLAGCKGRVVASDHADDRRFIERVVAGRRFTLADFEVGETQRPLQTIKKVINGEAACALVDDAQLAELPHLEGTDGLHAVWQSEELPPMVVSAFPTASADERERFQENLANLCEEEARSTCAEVGIVSLRAASATAYAAVIAAYGQ
jgi:phosphonate ABC transporter substrate-binding protein